MPVAAVPGRVQSTEYIHRPSPRPRCEEWTAAWQVVMIGCEYCDGKKCECWEVDFSVREDFPEQVSVGLHREQLDLPNGVSANIY